MKVMVSEIKDIAIAICNRYIENNGEYFETDQDGFWFVDINEAIDLRKIPSAWCVGSLEDDYLCLQEIVSKKREVNILDLERISNLFKLIAYEIEEDKGKIL